MPARYRLSKWYSSRRIRTTSRLFRRGAHRGRPRGTRPKDNKCWANSLPFSPFLVESEPIGIATRRAPRMGAPTNRRNLFPFNQTSKMFQVAGICSLPYSWRIQMIVPPNSNLLSSTGRAGIGVGLPTGFVTKLAAGPPRKIPICRIAEFCR